MVEKKPNWLSSSKSIEIVESVVFIRAHLFRLFTFNYLRLISFRNHWLIGGFLFSFSIDLYVSLCLSVACFSLHSDHTSSVIASLVERVLSKRLGGSLFEHEVAILSDLSCVAKVCNSHS